MALMGSEQLGSLVGVIKEKLKQKLMPKQKQKQKQKNKQKPYARMEKSASLRMEIKSMQARRLIDRTLKAADRPGKVSLPS